MLCRAFAAAFVVLVSQGPTITSPNVDLSGSWTLIGDAKDGALGTSVKMSQTPTSLTIEHANGLVESYTLNGETRHTLPPPVDDRITHANPAVTLWAYSKSSVTVSGWVGNQLVLVTHRINRVNSPGATPREFDAETTSELKLSLDAGGRLVVAQNFISDPLPQAMPSHVILDALLKFPKTSLYVKAPER